MIREKTRGRLVQVLRISGADFEVNRAAEYLMASMECKLELAH